MNDELLRTLEGRLRARESALRDRVQSHRDRLGEPASATGNTFIAGIEGARADADDEREVALLMHDRHELDEVLAALQRIRQGTYGMCSGCGETIEMGRLRVAPEARLCLGCQRSVERHVAR